MKEYMEDNLIVFEAEGLNDPDFVKSNCLVTSVRVECRYGHDIVFVFNRGALSGELIVKAGDGPQLAQRLLEG